MAHTTAMHPQVSAQPSAHARSLLRTWLRRVSRRRALKREFAHASPQWLERIERDIGLEPGQLTREMSKPFWAG